MRYFVISEGGQKYGPADVATLNSWIAEQRLLPSQQLEEESSGIRMAATAVQGLNFAVQASGEFAPGKPYQQFYNRPGMPGIDDGAKDLKNAWTYCVFGFICMLGYLGIAFAVLGIVSANKAIAKGNPAGNKAKLANIIALVVDCIALPVGIMIRLRR